MDFHPDLVRHLDHLSAALDDGTDLHAILTVLADDLVASIPEFLGLDLSMTIAGTPFTITTRTADTGTSVRASLLLPLARMGLTDGAEGTLIYYAGAPEAFTSLVADVRDFYSLDGQVVVDQHLEPATGPPAAGIDIDNFSVMHQAIGILLARGGSTLDEAHTTLQRLAEDNRKTPLDIAHQLVADPNAFY